MSARLGLVLVLVSATIPACLAILCMPGAGNVADAAHDAGVARVLGMDPQPWRTVERLPELALVALPVGTRAARAALGGALSLAAAGAVLHVLARRVLQLCAPTAALGSVVATIAAMSALLASSWQTEGVAGGAAPGALLVLAPLFIVVTSGPVSWPAPAWRWTALFVGLGLANDPLAGAGAMLSAAAAVAADRETRRSFVDACRREGSVLFAWALAGAAPALLGVAHARAAGASVSAMLAGLRDGAGFPFAFLRDAVGPVQGALLVAGAVLGLLVPRVRGATIGLLALVALGPLCGAGESRVAAPLLAAIASACVLGGVAMQAAVRAVARANVPFAPATAAMVVVLELVIPVEAADEALLRARSGPDVAMWDALAWDSLPPRAVVLLTSPRIVARAFASRAQGSLRDDLVFVPAYEPPSRSRRALAPLAHDAALVPLWRDLELYGAPGSASLSALASTRAVAMAYEPRWGKELGRHLVPLALFDLFEPEPRGASDRRKGLASFQPLRERLAVATRGDAELAEATAILLRARARQLAAGADRELLGEALEDLHAFAPGDPAGAEIVGQAVPGK